MKKLLFILPFILLLSCSNNNEESTEEHAINDRWFLKQINHPFADFDSYSDKYVLWNFTPNSLDVTNYVDIYFETGQYSFTIINDLQININETIYEYRLYNNNETLTIAYQPEADGETLVFEKRNFGCIDNPLEDLEWLSTIKANFENNENEDIITQYVYNNETVFLIPDCQCADALYTIYACNGDVICQFGSIAGINTCNDWFLENATNAVILYED